MANLTIVANIIVNADKIDFIRAELVKLVEKTLTEEGCINYNLHQDNKNPAHFMIYEKWQTRELWQAHGDTQHFADYVAAAENSVSEFSVHEMTFIAG
ncbi:putative quinol monooxygenase [Paraglaciecola arctica]|uniref:putative quinol monooxygenase n=1 Tax=Paraglaciecola arctica TaxID=1128911 RepID=UPI001C067CAD|nr:putative quinol monooxygenase [Paraglaciecola arctica]MBU3005450.1 antibiotic biosynthesis monooxygenase [Paraglaciecola arctica]